MTYVNVPIETDSDALAQDAFDYLANKMPGWEPSDAQLDTWLIEANSGIAATVREMASDVSTSIFRWYGANVVGIQPLESVAAVGLTTWTMTDNIGHTIPAGAAVGLRDADGTLHGFEVRDDVVVPAGSNSTGAGAVTIIALEEGAAMTGLSGPVEMIDALSFVNTVTLPNPTTGGQDAEDDDVYLNRLVLMLQLMAPRPILPNDFATMVVTMIQGVGRATAIDGYNPVDLSSGNIKMVAVFVVDASGNAVSAATRNAADALLQSQREVNFIVNVLDPTYTTIDVTYAVKAWPGYDQAAILANCNAAIAAYLDPAVWGAPPFGDTVSWVNQTKVKINDLIIALGKVEGVDDVTSVTIRTGAAAYAAVDITMTGPAPLPHVGVVNGAVS